ncbi:MAG TPA: glycosyltransferase family 2 protein [Pyrinomonadaceae bacterium]|jgi:cellulose synthase/poly-beta-1,6-N-acetylglucosamine synthase-like glycosyltransferase
MLIFYFFAGIVLWLGILSLRGGLRFTRYVRTQLAQPLPDYTPFVSVIAPCRGLEAGLAENIAALFRQDYPAYEIIFVTGRADDPSVDLINKIVNDQASPASARIVIAGDAIDRGQKVHNLTVAVSQLDPRSEVIVFVDTDARPNTNWLRSLVAPLANTDLGATTGYRWFVPVRGGIAAELRSVWNASIASALGEREDKNFCWGGSTAMRRSTFESLAIAERWRGTVSDDFTVTRVLQEAKLPIHFAPACFVASVGDCNWKELFEFTNRQLKITRVYATHLWRPLLIGSLLFCAVFFGGLLLTATRVALQLPYRTPLLILFVIYGLGAAKAYIRFRAVALALPSYRKGLNKSLPAHLLLWPVSAALYLFNALAAAASRRINWRGITYELKSATEAVIIDQ